MMKNNKARATTFNRKILSRRAHLFQKFNDGAVLLNNTHDFKAQCEIQDALDVYGDACMAFHQSIEAIADYLDSDTFYEKYVELLNNVLDQMIKPVPLSISESKNIVAVKNEREPVPNEDLSVVNAAPLESLLRSLYADIEKWVTPIRPVSASYLGRRFTLGFLGGSASTAFFLSTSLLAIIKLSGTIALGFITAGVAIVAIGLCVGLGALTLGILKARRSKEKEKRFDEIQAKKEALNDVVINIRKKYADVVEKIDRYKNTLIESQVLDTQVNLVNQGKEQPTQLLKKNASQLNLVSDEKFSKIFEKFSETVMDRMLDLWNKKVPQNNMGFDDEMKIEKTKIQYVNMIQKACIEFHENIYKEISAKNDHGQESRTLLDNALNSEVNSTIEKIFQGEKNLLEELPKKLNSDLVFSTRKVSLPQKEGLSNEEDTQFLKKTLENTIQESLQLVENHTSRPSQLDIVKKREGKSDMTSLSPEDRLKLIMHEIENNKKPFPPSSMTSLYTRVGMFNGHDKKMPQTTTQKKEQFNTSPNSDQLTQFVVAVVVH